MPRPKAPRANSDDPDFMTVREIAEYLPCSYSTIFSRVQSGEIPGFRVGSNWRVPRDALEKWMAEKQVRRFGNLRAGNVLIPPMKRFTRQTDVLAYEPKDEMMTVQQVAKYLRCHRRQVLRLVKSGELRRVGPGRLWRFFRSDIEKFTKSNGYLHEGQAPELAKATGRGIAGLPDVGSRRESEVPLLPSIPMEFITRSGVRRTQLLDLANE